MFPKFCEACYETDPNKLQRCGACKFASFCKEGDCQLKAEANPDIHTKYCADKKIAFLCYRDYKYKNVFTKMPKPLNFAKFLESNSVNCNLFTLIEHITGKKFIRNPANREEMNSCATVCQFTFTASIIYALEKANLLDPERESLNIHIVGAQNELDLFDKTTYGLFYVFLPNLNSLKISFVGPDIYYPASLSAEVDFFGKTINVDFCKMFYEDFPRPKPDFVMCFGSGFNDYHWEGPGTPDTDWVRGMKKILRHRVPFAFTTFIKAEIIDDARFVKRVAQHINVYQDLTGTVLGPNPFQDVRPFQNADPSSDEPLLYANQRICVMSWKELLGPEFVHQKAKFDQQIQ